MINRSYLHTGLCLVSLMLVACSSTEKREDFTSLATLEREAISNQRVTQWQQLDDAAPVNYLSDLIQDEKLDALIEQALQANPSLQKMQLTLQASLWGIKSQRGDRLPSVEAGLSSSKSEGNSTQYSADVGIRWEADLWNKLALSEASSTKTLASDEAQYQASRDTLAANVMKSWLAITANARAIEIEKKRLALLQSNEALIIKRFRNGLGDLEALDEASTSTAQSQSDLAKYQEDLAIEKRNLQLYLGSTDPLLISANVDYPTVALPLASLPEQTLHRRPDLKAAYLSIEAADLNTSVAYKDMLPSISLSATLSETAESPTKALFGSPIWSLIGQLTQPLYQGGKLEAAAEIAKLETAQAYQDYKDTLLTAVNEVDNALGQESLLLVQKKYTQDALLSAQKNLLQYERKYRTGLVELNDLINAQTTAFNLEAELDNIIYQHLSNRVNLGLALGLGVQGS
ncbi:TolC family protein [Marinomonas algarum]|uniref:TolC family protein n=1 Tax=Marinomonas algarum TaxID=2883105 RepID=A0A9X1LF17_9GAMM|nr:TolC family protein [Marinomonas algarum]MCB5162446.1 TolC family protein [Marinomonas algarum]